MRIFRTYFLKVFLLFMVLMLPLANTSYGADATGFNPIPIMVVSKNTGGGVPVGSIIAWPSYGNPADANKWLECNGQSTAGYPELAAVVGGTVPDYRGLFLRGYGSQASYHYGAVAHASVGLGVLQGDGIREISGRFAADVITDGNQVADGAFYDGGGITQGDDGTNGGLEYRFYGFSASRVTPVTNEIRPVNKAVRYLIRAAK